MISTYEMTYAAHDEAAIKKAMGDAGFLVIRGFFSKEDLGKVWQDMDSLTDAFCERFGLITDTTSADERERRIVSLIAQRPGPQSVIYQRLQQMPSLLAVPNHPKVRALAELLLDTQRWGVWPRVQVRLDLYDDEVNLIEWHHDYLYNRGTTASYTFWMPLASVEPSMGGLDIAIASHHANDIEFVTVEGNNRYQYTLDENTLSRFEVIRADQFQPGDLVVFHSLVLHSGLRNANPSRARLTGLFRMQDLNQLEDEQ